uniref:Nuclear pore complex protein Nup85 n=1 Tax=Ditylenchus dipsaci TaxID=166011 RepID=A0A915D111_9BILA
MKFLREKEWSTSLGWALRNGSHELIDQVSHKVLINADPECIAQMRIFDAMSDTFLTTPELVLLYKFYTFKRHAVRGELKEAVADLHQLFIDNSSPAEFHAILFEEMIKMLSATLGNGYGGDIQLPNLDKNAILDMFRAISLFQKFQSIRTGGYPPSKDVNLTVKTKSMIF